MRGNGFRRWCGWLLVAAICCLPAVPRARATDAAAPRGHRKAVKNPDPVYPEIARALALRGAVKVEVVIGADGAIKSTKVIGGHPILVQAVEQALKNWKFEAGKESTQVLEFHFSGH